MANLLNNQFNNLRLELNCSEYWDFFLNKDAMSDFSQGILGKNLYVSCLSTYIDFEDKDCVFNNEIIKSKKIMNG